MNIWRLIGGRQAHFGVDQSDNPDDPTNTRHLGIQESHGEFYLSEQYGRKVEIVETLPDDASREQIFDALARWEELGMTWVEQHEELLRKYPDPDDWTNGQELRQP